MKLKKCNIVSLLVKMYGYNYDKWRFFHCQLALNNTVVLCSEMSKSILSSQLLSTKPKNLTRLVSVEMGECDKTGKRRKKDDGQP